MQHLVRMTLTDCSNGFHFFELWHIHLFLRVYYFIHLAASLPAPACLSDLSELKGARVGMSLLDFSKSVNPISTVESRLCTPRYYRAPRNFRPPTALYLLHRLYGFSSPNKLGCLGYGIWCSGFYTAGQNRFHNSSLLRLHSETGLLI